MEPQRKHVAVVLAAGGSSRLGMPKQLLRRNGETLVRRTVRLATATNAVRVIVVLGAEHDRIAGELSDIPHTPVINADWATGIAGSLRTAAPFVPADHAALILTCDQPALAEHHLHALLAGAHAAPERSAATDIGQVLCIPAVVPGGWFEDSNAYGDRGFRARLRGFAEGAVFALRAPELSVDIDTPADLQVAVAQGLLDASA